MQSESFMFFFVRQFFLEHVFVGVGDVVLLFDMMDDIVRYPLGSPNLSDVVYFDLRLRIYSGSITWRYLLNYCRIIVRTALTLTGSSSTIRGATFRQSRKIMRTDRYSSNCFGFIMRLN